MLFLTITFIVGAAIFTRGLWQLGRLHLLFRGNGLKTPDLIHIIRGLRAALVGLSIVGWATGAMYGVYWLEVAALVIGLEELYETTMVLGFLRDKSRREASAAAAAPG